jgi:hypothetical protein
MGDRPYLMMRIQEADDLLHVVPIEALHHKAATSGLRVARVQFCSTIAKVKIYIMFRVHKLLLPLAQEVLVAGVFKCLSAVTCPAVTEWSLTTAINQELV